MACSSLSSPLCVSRDRLPSALCLSRLTVLLYWWSSRVWIPTPTHPPTRLCSWRVHVRFSSEFISLAKPAQKARCCFFSGIWRSHITKSRLPTLNMTYMGEFDPNFGWSNLLCCRSLTQSLASHLRGIAWSEG